MSLFARIRGRVPQYSNPPSVGQVLALTSPLLSHDTALERTMAMLLHSIRP